jgi:hypothetical protein
MKNETLEPSTGAESATFCSDRGDQKLNGVCLLAGIWGIVGSGGGGTSL